MNKFSPLNLLVAAALFGIAAESAWSEEATSSAPAAPAEQTTSSETGDVPGYAPTPYWRGHEQRWQPPPWPERPPGYYDHFRPYYPPYRQYRSGPAAPAVNPLSAELKQTQDQLAAKTSELNTANQQLLTLQAEQQASKAALQQAQDEIDAASQQLGIAIEDMDIINNVLTDLKARLDVQNTRLLGAVQAGAAENDKVDSAVAGDAEQMRLPATTSGQTENVGGVQTEAGDSELTKPEAGQAN